MYKMVIKILKELNEKVDSYYKYYERILEKYLWKEHFSFLLIIIYTIWIIKTIEIRLHIKFNFVELFSVWTIIASNKVFY